MKDDPQGADGTAPVPSGRPDEDESRAESREPDNGGPNQVPASELNAEARDALAGERERRRLVHLRERRYIHFARAIGVGILAGGIAVLFQWSLFYAEDARGQALVYLHQYPTWGWLGLPAAGALIGALVGWMVSRLAPATSGSGIPHVEAVLLRLRPLRWGRILVVKFVTGVLGIGVGLSLGREGPTVQMGAALGKGLARGLRVPERSESHLIVAGAGAGLAAAFNAPLAGFIFVLEELQREFSSITYGTGLIAALGADIVTRSFTGQLPSFHVTGYPAPPLSSLPLVALLGLLCGMMGVLFNRTLMWSIRRFEARPCLPLWGRTALAGFAAGLVAWWLPQAVGGGHQTAERILRGEFTSLSFILILMTAKFALTMLSYSSGAPGGIFAPLLTIGALLGLAVGEIGGRWAPELAATPAAFGVLGMAALFTSIVRAPLTGIVLITEMTANYEQLLAVALACLTAYLVAELLGEKPIYEELLEHDLQRQDPRPSAADEPVLLDLVVEPGSTMDGAMVRDLGLPAGCLLVTVKRAGRETVPGGGSVLRAGDHAVFIVAGEAVSRIPWLREAARSRLA